MSSSRGGRVPLAKCDQSEVVNWDNLQVYGYMSMSAAMKTEAINKLRPLIIK